MIGLIPVSVGELVDKLTILSIKLERIQDDAKLKNIKVEHTLLDAELRKLPIEGQKGAELLILAGQLQEINEKIWVVEDHIRDHERRKDFGPSFVSLARNVYQYNDRRAKIKKEINNLVGSTLTEEKSYKPY